MQHELITITTITAAARGASSAASDVSASSSSSSSSSQASETALRECHAENENDQKLVDIRAVKDTALMKAQPCTFMIAQAGEEEDTNNESKLQNELTNLMKMMAEAQVEQQGCMNIGEEDEGKNEENDKENIESKGKCTVRKGEVEGDKENKLQEELAEIMKMMNQC